MNSIEHNFKYHHEPVKASAVHEAAEGRLAVAALAVEVGPNKAVPDDIQWMPPGKHRITARRGDEVVTMDVVVNEKTAEAIQNVFKELSARAASGLGDAPYFDFNHDDKEASAHPVEFYWAGDDPRTGGVRAKVAWTEPGKKAVLGKAYRRFSPQFYPNANGEVVGAPVNMGGLVNRAAFKSIQPLFAKSAEQPETNKQPMDPTKDTPTDLNGAIAMIAALRGKLAESDNAKALAAKDARIQELEGKISTLEKEAKDRLVNEAKAVIARAVSEGRIPSQNTDLQKHYEDLYLASPVAAKSAIENLPVNPALATVVQGGNPPAPGQGASNEHPFLVKAKAWAKENNATFTDATVAVAGKEPALYADYCKNLVPAK